MDFDTAHTIITVCVGMAGFFIILFGCFVCRRLLTGGSMGTLRIVRDEKGDIISMKTTL